MMPWMQEKEKRENESLERHRQLSHLFEKDRLSFERERRRMIAEVIDSAGSEDLKDRLRQIQATWDKRMKQAGSPHNRYVLAQTFFWEHFYDVWQPALKDLSDTFRLKPAGDTPRRPPLPPE